MPTLYLVGAGPGDPGLLTCAGADALRRADVCIYDYLANVRLLELLPPNCRRIYVGKSAGQHTLTQEQINALLVETAQALAKSKPEGGGVVVRLKGGDPFIFGRGGEEAMELRTAGIPFVIVPGITAGIAGAAYAGIPATQRNLATSVTLVTGHESEEKGGGTPTLDVATLSALLAGGGTVIFYMGVRNLPDIAAQFLAALRARNPQAAPPPPIPAAVIEWATHPHQRTVVGDLSNIAAKVEAAGIKPPAIILFGQVAQFRDQLNWFETRPLFGRTVLVTRTRQQASQLAAGLADLGARVLEAPTIELAEPDDWSQVDRALLTLARSAERTTAAQVAAAETIDYDWVVFTSSNGVRAAWERLQKLGLDARALAGARGGIAAVGPVTAAALAEIGITAELIPETFTGDALAPLLSKLLADKGKTAARMLMLRADIARPALREALERAGAHIHDVPVYRTVRPATLPDVVLGALDRGEIHWVTFTSGSTALNLFEMLDEKRRAVIAAAKRISIGPQTSATLQRLGWPATLEAQEHDIPGMLAALRRQAGP